MGLLDMLFGGGDQPSAKGQAIDPMAINPMYGIPEGLLAEMKKEQQKAEMGQAWANLFGGAANIARGVQGGPPIYEPGSAGGGAGGSGLSGMDGIVERAMKFSQLRSQIQSQQSVAQIRQAIAADPNLTPAEKQAYATNPEAYLKLMEKGVERRMGPDDLDIKYDPDNRIVGAFNRKTQTMLTEDEAAKRGIKYATGPVPSKQADSENQLLGNYMASPEVKTYAAADPIYRSIVKSASTDTGASDLDMVYGIAKILDPTSVVREGEIQMANSTGGTVAMFQGLLNQLNGGAKLNAETRAKLLDMAQNRMGELRGAHDQVTGQLTDIATRRGLNKDNIVTRRYDALPSAPVYSPETKTLIPDEYVARLRSIDIRENPEAIFQFNKRFGEGTAQRVLRIR